jgi:hypothetical protein
VSRKNTKNFAQGQAVAERETADGWGGPDTGASPLPLDQHHTRRSYMGYGELPQDTRRQLAMPGDELARIVTNVSAPQIVHTATTTRRGMPGIADEPGSGPLGKVKAVIRHDYGLGPLVDRPADEGRDPIDRYVGARALIPPPTGPRSGHSRLHENSQFETAGDDLLAAFAKE